MKYYVLGPLTAVAFTALVAGSTPANAQFACSPPTVTSGAEFHLTSTAKFGATRPAGVAVEVFAGAGAPRGLTILNWAASDVLVRLPGDIPPGPYGVRITTPAGTPQQNPSCVTVRAVVSAPIRPTTAAAGTVVATLTGAVDGDPPCTGTTMITLWGSHFRPGTESVRHIGWPGETLVLVGAPAWASGKTVVELGGTRGAYPPVRPTASPRLVILDQGTMQLTLDRCILLWPGLKARIWFPDGTKSAWQPVRTAWDHP
jgi:hypothetical protein